MLRPILGALSTLVVISAVTGPASAAAMTIQSLEDQGYLVRSVTFDAQNYFNLFLQKASGGPIYVCVDPMSSGPATVLGCALVHDTGQ